MKDLLTCVKLRGVSVEYNN